MSKEVDSIKEEVKKQGNDMQRRIRTEERIQFQLKQIRTELQSISTTVQKDAGWRGFLLDFIKAAAQIAALVGAGKFIF